MQWLVTRSTKSSRAFARETTSPGVLRVAWAFVCLPLLLCSCSSEIEFEALETLETLQSEDLTVVIEVAKKPQDDGSTAFRIRRIDRDEDIVVYESTIANGGEALSLDNLLPELRSPSDLRLCLNGREQADLSVRMNVLARVVASNERRCTG